MQLAELGLMVHQHTTDYFMLIVTNYTKLRYRQQKL